MRIAWQTCIHQYQMTFSRERKYIFGILKICYFNLCSMLPLRNTIGIIWTQIIIPRESPYSRPVSPLNTNMHHLWIEWVSEIVTRINTVLAHHPDRRWWWGTLPYNEVDVQCKIIAPDQLSVSKLSMALAGTKFKYHTTYYIHMKVNVSYVLI